MNMSTPRLLPEWAPHTALWVGWPRLAEEWGGELGGARAEIAGFIHAAARFVPVRVAAGSDEAAATARSALGMIAEVYEIPCGDIWLRDTGPIVTGSGRGRVAEVFRFNGWGGKYLMPGDAETGRAIARFEGIAVREQDLVLEGGAIDADGAGRLLTTAQCLLNRNRNPSLTRGEIEARIAGALGITQYIWLGDGLANDHTDGHVDNAARFIAPGHAVCQRPANADDPNTDVLRAVETALKAAGLRVSTIPSPGRIDFGDGIAQPASHMNFTLTNGAVLVPVYEDHFSRIALAELQALFPRRAVIGLPATAILAGGGSFHCMSREIPF
jgi:agmatine deiminase